MLRPPVELVLVLLLLLVVPVIHQWHDLVAILTTVVSNKSTFQLLLEVERESTGVEGEILIE